jgi:hypothetical protein
MLSKKIILASFPLIALLMVKCGGSGEPIENPGVASLNTMEEKTINLNEWIGSGDVMAYVLTDDKEHLYLAEAFRSEMQEALKAEVKDQKWIYTNASGVKETRTEHSLKDFAPPTIAIVEWAYARGYQCLERPAGYVLPVHKTGDRGRKPFAGYQLTESGKWCEDIRRGGRCKFYWKKVTSRFIKVNDRGQLVKRNGEYVLSDTATISIMACVDE